MADQRLWQRQQRRYVVDPVESDTGRDVEG
jgi:hypothetical protein